MATTVRPTASPEPFRFFSGLSAESDISASGLEIQTVGAGGDFPVLILRWHPDFDIVSLSRGESNVSRAQADDMIRQF